VGILDKKQIQDQIQI